MARLIREAAEDDTGEKTSSLFREDDSGDEEFTRWFWSPRRYPCLPIVNRLLGLLMEFLFSENKMNKLKQKNRDSDHKVRKNLENCPFFRKSYPIDAKHRRIYPWQWVLPTLLQLQVCMLQCKQFVDVDRWPKSVAHTVRASGGVQKLRGDVRVSLDTMNLNFNFEASHKRVFGSKWLIPK